MKLIPKTTKDFGYLQIFDLYSKDELKSICREISYLDCIMNEIKLGSLELDKIRIEEFRGKYKNGSSKMSGDGIVLDKVYLDRGYSRILTLNRKLFTNKSITTSMASSHPANKKLYSAITRDMTILNRYSNSDKYTSHCDYAAFTAITVILKNPESIKGGHLMFPDYDITFECKDNSCIIFPSWVNHCVTSLDSCCGGTRYSLAQLMYIAPK